jgi:tetratricopeptide (TPR) repeat protein
MKTHAFPAAGLLLAGVLLGCGGTDGSAALSRGDAFLKDGKTREAAIEYQIAVQADARNGDARLKLGLALRTLGEGQRSMEQLVRAADLLPENLEAQLEASRALLSEGQYEDARARADAVLRVDARNARAHILRGTATAGMKDVEGAIESIQQAAKLNPENADALVDLGVLQMSQGKLAEAEADFKQAVAVAPKSPEPLLSLAAFYFTSKRMADAEATLLRAIDLDANHSMANQALAGLYRSSGRSNLAEAPLKRMAESSNDAEAKLVLADYYLAERRVADARPILATLSSDAASSAAAQTRLAAIEYDSGKREVAYKMLDDVLAKEPANAAVMVVRGGWLLREAKYEDALAYGTKATQNDPKSAEAFSLLGSIHIARNDPEAAIKDFTSVLQLQPDSFSAQIAMTGLYLSLGQVRQAGEFARQAVANAPNRAGPRHALARVLLAEGKPAEADRELAPVLVVAPNSVNALNLRGMIRQRQGDTAAARADFQRALAINPRSPEALAGLAQIEIAAKRPREAAKLLAAAVDRAPNNAQLLFLAGQTQLANGDLDGAQESFQKALQADATLMPVYDALGQLLVRQNKLDEARLAYDRQAQERPNDVAAHTMVARILYVQGKPAESRARFEKILSIDPRAAVASNNLAYLDAEAGVNLDVALNRAQVAKAALPDDPDINDTLGWVYVKRGLPALAIAPLQQAISKDPKNPLYHYHLGAAHAKAGDRDRARLSLQKALEISKTFDGAADAQRTLDGLGR